MRASGVYLPKLWHHGSAFTFALRWIRADQIGFRANPTERE